MLRPFHVSVHARPPSVAPGEAVVLGDRSVRTLTIAPSELAAVTFPCSFETALDRLAALDRMYIELDGSFVWTSASAQSPWQLDGNLYDRKCRLLFVDLKGHCPAEQLDRLLGAFDWPATRVVFQLTREAVLLEEGEFRRYARAID